MAEITLNTSESIDTSNDNIVIVNCEQDIPGGKALDVTDWDPTTIPAGHPIILGTDGEYKPIPLEEDGITIDDTDADKTVGILLNTILTAQPAAAIMRKGTVNESAAVYEIPSGCKTALQTGGACIDFISD